MLADQVAAHAHDLVIAKGQTGADRHIVVSMTHPIRSGQHARIRIDLRNGLFHPLDTGRHEIGSTQLGVPGGLDACADQRPARLVAMQFAWLIDRDLTAREARCQHGRRRQACRSSADDGDASLGCDWLRLCPVAKGKVCRCGRSHGTSPNDECPP